MSYDATEVYQLPQNAHELAAKLVDTSASIFYGVPASDMTTLLRDPLVSLLDPVPPKLPSPKGQHSFTEGSHLFAEADPFNAIYVILAGSVVRYSLFACPRSTSSQNQPGTPGEPVLFKFLAACTQKFDQAYEMETVGIAEMVTGSHVWLTSAFQCRRTKLLRLPTDFLGRLPVAAQHLIFQNLATSAVSLWLTNRRDFQEYMARMDMGEKELEKRTLKTSAATNNQDSSENQNSERYSDDRTEDKKYTILHFLGILSRRVRLLPAVTTHGRVTNEKIHIFGTVERLSWYLGMRKSSMTRAWEALRGMRRLVGGKSHLVPDRVIVEPTTHGYAVYDVKLEKLCDRRFFMNDLEEMLGKSSGDTGGIEE